MLYYIISGILVLGILYGINLMSKVGTARLGNYLSAVCTALAIVVTLYKYELFAKIWLYVFMGAGLVMGLILAKTVKMIEMPQTVAVLNGFGGLASALVSIIAINEGNTANDFATYTAALALVIGLATFLGSMVAAGKLHKILPQKPIVLRAHSLITNFFIVLSVVSVCIIKKTVWSAAIFSSLFGIVFSIRVGGADMPITISLLNSLSGVAGGIAGIAIYDPLLTAAGGIVGASGLILTQIMCKAMNRKLSDILLGKTSVLSSSDTQEETPIEEVKEEIS
ncbi:MAG TPA: NAD(P)(+) transhydrogenase (Re/Si-specific) subunit beta, partial [Clostridiaceae bacterium]|nr:NAD(P)(+) transhydrogenase (Re/Si-specific) subunit beta [Clostridiaceae bacterium]